MCKVYSYVLQVLWFGVIMCKPELNSINDYPVRRVVNGIPVQLGEIPYQIALKKPVTKQSNLSNPIYFTFCGGAIIGEMKILSAAHCFFLPPPDELCATEERVGLDNKYAVAGAIKNLGRYKSDFTTEQWRVMKEVFTPKYYFFPDDDIAVVIVEEPFVLNKYVNWIPYATKTIDYGYIQCTASGFGKVSEQGDSGGPLVCHNTGDPNEGASGVLVGVVCGKREFRRGYGTGGTFFTRVSDYGSFIGSSSNIKSQADSINEYPVPRVVNGRPAALGQIPYQVAIKKPDGRREQSLRNPIYYTFCGGAIIGEAKVVSAAHCFLADPVDDICGKEKTMGMTNMYAVAGTVRNIGRYKSDGESTEQWRQIAQTVSPETHHFPKDDIAVATTKAPFVFNAYVSPVPLASVNIDYGRRDCIVSGYGKISHTADSDSLLWARLTLIPKLFCNYLHEENMNKFICTASDVSDLLEGDSGGPLVCRNTSDPSEGPLGVLVGVVSGKKEYDDGVGGGTFFTRVSTHLPRVVNGIPARPGELPYQVAIKTRVEEEKHQANPTYYTFCGGAILGEKKILSAAHCFFFTHGWCPMKKRLELGNLYAVAGTLNTQGRYKADKASTEQWRRMTYAHTLSSFKFPEYDIAVVNTEEPFVFNVYVSPLPHASLNIDYGAIDCIMAGYGKVTYDLYSDRLLWAKLTLIPRAVCSELHNNDMNNFICTQSDVSDMLQGDSGGPLVCLNTGDPNEGASGVIVGVASGKRSVIGEFGGGTFYTRVSSFHQFIENRSSLTKPATYCILLVNYIKLLILLCFIRCQCR